MRTQPYVRYIPSTPSTLQIYTNGFRFNINGGVIVQSDQFKTDKVHLGFVRDGSVTWIDFSEFESTLCQ